MAQNNGWACSHCGWELGQVRDGDLYLYGRAIPGEGEGDIPDVLAVIKTISRVPVRCSNPHCGHVEIWDANLRALKAMLERTLKRSLNAEELRRLAAEIGG